MPTYSMKCKECGEKFKMKTKVNEEIRCPECNGETERIFNPKNVGVIFKGSGFYETDYKDKK